ncbi:prolipoprotein diacylglyceryl transferase [Streptosporangium lutulentum]|uniref:Phosphatidylglycerol--prolipoprotein diacylglyceryl transferase n=1 Tax=Streptosporangium lutulentum TaxID=1461250 RepID=A0ABT9QFD8_9ACTN|nr:prolipoprotein diacylglyceryl transferase [Streptosporangium lutulentum]MDP9845046.1 prolipoprotein diacylglyceryl transferase [Streptosporangium lutulentum]
MPLASIPSPSQGVWHLFGVVPLRAYALCIVLGVIVAVVIGERRWRARGGEPGTIVDLAVWAVPFGLVGGRLYHVITDWQLYFGPNAPNEPIEALYVWNGGLGIWGAVALGALGVWFGCRNRGISLSAVADTIAPGIVIAQAIGRWGNYFNQELFGRPTDLPWGLEIDPDRPGTVPGVDTYHPTFLYESLWDLALGLALIWIGRKFALRHGRVFALYLAGYTVGRFWIEGLRVDTAHHILGLRLNQWTSIVVFIGAMIYFWYARNKTNDEPVGATPEPTLGSPDIEGSAADPAHPSDQADTPEDGEGTARDEGPETIASAPGAANSVDPAHPSDQADEPGPADEDAGTHDVLANEPEGTPQSVVVTEPAEDDAPAKESTVPAKDGALQEDVTADAVSGGEKERR